MLGVLEQGPAAVRDIVAATGLCRPIVKDVLCQLRQQGLVTFGARTTGRCTGSSLSRVGVSAMDTAAPESHAAPTTS